MAVGDITILPLSGSTNGKPITITATTSGTAQTIHTATSTSGQIDMITLYFSTLAGTATLLHIGWGGVTTAEELDITVPGTRYIRKIIEKFPLENGLVVSAWCDNPSVCNLIGVVERYSVS